MTSPGYTYLPVCATDSFGCSLVSAAGVTSYLADCVEH